MVTEDGTVVASADRVGRTRWTVKADDRLYTFQRASIWRQEQILCSEDRQVDSIKRTSIWPADLLSLSLPVQTFALAVVLTMWDAAAVAAAGNS